MRTGGVRGALASLVGFALAFALVIVVAAPTAAQKGPKKSPSPTPTPSESPSPEPSRSPASDDSEGSEGSSGAQGASSTPRPEPSPKPAPDENDDPPPLAPSIYGYGPYNNDTLVALATKLKAFGSPQRYVRKNVFAPFIIEGPARWQNTWGALRVDPDGTKRRHLGQDVFCAHGAPVLAAEAGKIVFSTDRLGGLIARLHREGGGYFYYAHLSGFGTGLVSGDRVTVGDVIGYCGDTGNAEGGAPHVHFGYYAGGAQDPMGFLLRWNEEAEHRARRALDSLLESADVSTFARRLGEGILPDLVIAPTVGIPDDGATTSEDPLERLLGLDPVD